MSQDMDENGVKDDKLALIFNINSEIKVAVKTPVGKSDRRSIHNVIAQGDCLDLYYEATK